MREELSSLLADAPPVANVGWVSDKFGVVHGTVVHAIKTGKLPATPVADALGVVHTYNIRPLDALLIWGHRLRQPSGELATA